MKKTNVVIIGGGAAGLMAACSAAKCLNRKGSVTVIEGNQKLGRKLLATGNGRCNLTNLNVSAEHYHGDSDKIVGLLAEYSPQSVMGIFREMGLVTKADPEGRVYPRNLQAAAVLTTLRNYAEELGVEFLSGIGVDSVEKRGVSFTVSLADGDKLTTEKCILACGGAASPKHSCAGNGYELAKSLGHSVTALYPALTQLICKNKRLKSLSGTRCAANIDLVADKQVIYSESGEVQFTDSGLSGICIFGVSIYASEFFALGRIGNAKYKSVQCVLDMLPDMSFSDIVNYIEDIKCKFPKRCMSELLIGLLPAKLGTALIAEANADASADIGSLAPSQIRRIASLIKAWRLDISGTKGWNEAQVTAGGIPLSELDTKTMGSKKCRGLFLAGEMLNIHGDCGGYNLHFAWASGAVAGKAAAGDFLKRKEVANDKNS